MSSGSTDGAHSRKTVDGGGSSTILSSAFAAPSVRRSASSMTTTCQRPGWPSRRDLHDGAHLVDADAQAFGMIRRTSACVPAIVVVQALHLPQPGSPSAVHCSAAAKLTAATDRPDPGGPVINHACVVRRRRIVSGITAGRPRRPRSAPLPLPPGPPDAQKHRSSVATVVLGTDTKRIGHRGSRRFWRGHRKSY